MGYPNGSGIALLEGTLKHRYYTFPFAGRKPTWRLPTPGHVLDVLTTGGESVGLLGFEPPGGSSGRAGFVRQSFKRVRLTKKTRCRIVWEEEGFTKLYSQSPTWRIMTLWRSDLLGMGGGLPGGCMECPAQGQAGSGRDWLNMCAWGGGRGGTALPRLQDSVHACIKLVANASDGIELLLQCP